MRHGLPDAPRIWTLEARAKRSKQAPEGPPLRVCAECAGVYVRFERQCPYCGVAHVPAARSTPEQVDGDLAELSPEALLELRGGVEWVDMPVDVFQAKCEAEMSSTAAVRGAVAQHQRRQSAQCVLRSAIQAWADTQNGDDRHVHMVFYNTFGIDVLSAQALGRPEAEKLTKIIGEIV